jgi:hypothetical protein
VVADEPLQVADDGALILGVERRKRSLVAGLRVAD